VIEHSPRDLAGKEKRESTILFSPIKASLDLTKIEFGHILGGTSQIRNNKKLVEH
jgi:hypothetical protein